jgi:hypothetical protein
MIPIEASTTFAIIQLSNEELKREGTNERSDNNIISFFISINGSCNMIIKN